MWWWHQQNLMSHTAWHYQLLQCLGSHACSELSGRRKRWDSMTISSNWHIPLVQHLKHGAMETNAHDMCM
jgi:plasmid maintenance system killer protein